VIAALLGLLLQAGVRPQVTAVHAEMVDGRSALRIVATRPLTEARVLRHAEGIVFFLDADAAPGLRAPAPHPPVTSVHLQPQRQGGLEVKVNVPPETLYEMRRDENVTLILLGERPGPTTDVAELYKRIRPPRMREGLDEQTGGVQVVGTGDGAAEERGAGFYLGPIGVQPSLNLTYVDAEAFLLDTPRPVRDRYFEVQPSLGLELRLFKLRLGSEYAPRFRFGSAFSQVRQMTHVAELQLQASVGPSVALRGAGRYARGTLETLEVDPGREYFFQIGRYTHQSYQLGARVETGSLIDLDVAGTLDKVQVDDQSGFFDYESQVLNAAATYELGPSLRTFLGYSRGRIPFTPDRPEVESTWHAAFLRMTGEVIPLVDGELTVGYRFQDSPRAAAGGTRYRGTTVSLRLSKIFAPDTRMSLRADRTTSPSAFEGNAFFVVNAIQADLTAPLPFELALHAAAGYHRNGYRTLAMGLGEPRHDRLYGWSIGLGRPFTRRAFLRADYRKERRNSNVNAFDSRSHAFTIQLGIGLLRSSEAL